MTVITALEHKGKVFLAGDSFCGTDFNVDLCDESKVYSVANVGVGICGSVRCEQIFEKTLRKQVKNRKKITREWIQDTLAEIFRREMEKRGATSEMNGMKEMPHNSSFIIALNGQALIFQDDFSLFRSPRGYAAIGAGASYAKGALEALKNLEIEPEKKLMLAMEAAEELSPFVKGPHTIIEI